jgi:hypothetical protein
MIFNWSKHKSAAVSNQVSIHYSGEQVENATATTIPESTAQIRQKNGSHLHFDRRVGGAGVIMRE